MPTLTNLLHWEKTCFALAKFYSFNWISSTIICVYRASIQLIDAIVLSNKNNLWILNKYTRMKLSVFTLSNAKKYYRKLTFDFLYFLYILKKLIINKWRTNTYIAIEGSNQGLINANICIVSLYKPIKKLNKIAK